MPENCTPGTPRGVLSRNNKNLPVTMYADHNAPPPIRSFITIIEPRGIFFFFSRLTPMNDVYSSTVIGKRQPETDIHTQLRNEIIIIIIKHNAFFTV